MLLKNVEKLLAERQITLELTPAAQDLILREGYDPAYGARPLRRTIQRMIQDPLAMQILEGKVLPGDTSVWIGMVPGRSHAIRARCRRNNPPRRRESNQVASS